MSTQNIESSLATQPITRVKDPQLLARMVIREGKPFKESALAAGYSESMSVRGLKFAVSCSSAIATAVERESAQLTVGLDRLKPLAVKRLYEEIINPKSSNGMKAIELAGRFKETDWFVRNTDVNVGVFMGLSDAPPEKADDAIDAYQSQDKSAT